MPKSLMFFILYKSSLFLPPAPMAGRYCVPKESGKMNLLNLLLQIFKGESMRLGE